MTSSSHGWWWLALAALSSGCADEESETAGTGITVEDAPVTLSGTLRDELFAPIAGAAVCVLDHAEACVESDAEGHFAVEVPDDGDLALDIQAAEAPRHIVPIASGEADATLYILVFRSSVVMQIAQATGVALDPGKGIFGVMRSTDGATAGMSSGEGPFYFVGQAPSPGATTTQGAGTFFFMNVNPGTATLIFAHPTRVCDPPFWDHGNAGEEVPIVAGAVTLAERLLCY